MMRRALGAVRGRAARLAGKASDLRREFSHPAYRNWPLERRSDATHLSAAMAWLCRAQDVTGCGGVSAHYDLTQRRWQLPYRETTGYIIPTFLNYYLHSGDEQFLERARAMGDWEARVQLPDGAVFEPVKSARTGEASRDGAIGIRVFNTGMVLLGFVALFRVTAEERYLHPARLAGDWLLSVQREDGGWEAFGNEGPNGIHSLVAWALMELSGVTGERKYAEAATANVHWVLAQRMPSGWFANSSLHDPDRPWTHAVGYTLRGLLECARFLPESDAAEARKAVRVATEAMLGAGVAELEREGLAYLPRTLDAAWSSTDADSCLTGNAQMAIILLMLDRSSPHAEFRRWAGALIEGVKATQSLGKDKAETYGAIAGSCPIGRGYAPHWLLNWATKFFADALMVRNDWDSPQSLYLG